VTAASENRVADEAAENLRLVERARKGDASAFAALIARHERACLAIAYAKLRNPDVAGDVVQEAFLKAWQGIKTLGNAASFGAWLGQIVRNLATDLQRTKLRRGQVESLGNSEGLAADLAADESGNPTVIAAGHETARLIEAALGKLDEKSREIVTLRYFDGLASREIGAMIGMSPAAVDMRLSRARQELREMLGSVVDPFVGASREVA
jgi:RNA polymerase sigma-70 factor, ECF subfamily